MLTTHKSANIVEKRNPAAAHAVALPIKATLMNSPADTSIVEMSAFALLLLPLDLFALTHASRSKRRRF